MRRTLRLESSASTLTASGNLCIPLDFADPPVGNLGQTGRFPGSCECVAVGIIPQKLRVVVRRHSTPWQGDRLSEAAIGARWLAPKNGQIPSSPADGLCACTAEWPLVPLSFPRPQDSCATQPLTNASSMRPSPAQDRCLLRRNVRLRWTTATLPPWPLTRLAPDSVPCTAMPSTND